MRKTNTQKISDVLKEYLEQNQIDNKLKTSGVARYWEKLMGKVISQKTTNIYIKNKILFIYLSSSVLRNELLMMRSKIIQLMNEQMGGNYIEKVVLK